VQEHALGDSDRQTLAHHQLEYGNTNTHSMCAKARPAIVTASSGVEVKSVCAASPGRCCCASITSLSGPRSARHAFTRRWSVRSCPSS